MKKLSIITAAVAALLSFSACEADKDPQYVKPAEDATFHLNTPVFANHVYELTEDGILELTCDAPDYGFIAITTYDVQVALDPKDFQPMTTTAEDGSITVLKDKELTTCQIVKTVDGTQTKMQVSEMLISAALTTLYGATGEEDMPQGAQEIYVRAVAHLDGVPSSYVYSNPVKLIVDPYFRVREPNYIYLVGKPSGWIEPSEANVNKYADWHLAEREDAIDSGIFYGEFPIEAGGDNCIFRFYTALTGWEEDSWGSQKDDNPLEFTIEEAQEGLAMVKGKGSYQFPDWEGGIMYIKVDSSSADMKVYMSNEPIDPVAE